MTTYNGNITFLISPEETRIEFIDSDSGVQFLVAKLTPKQLVDAMSRIGHTPCKLEIRELEKIGKKRTVHEEIIELSPKINYQERAEKAKEIIEDMEKYQNKNMIIHCGGSRDSFFYKNNKQFARATVWVWE